MSKFLIVGFDNEESEFAFIRRIGDATIESLLYCSRVEERPTSIPIVQVRKIATGNRQFYSQYHAYSALFYMNETAVEMCQDAGLTLTVVGEVEVMTDEASYDLEAEYLPLSQRSGGELK